jgi:predicted alpha/beta-fold hydrolase
MSNDEPSNEPFRPARWLSGGHGQTMYGPLLRPWPRPRTARERWELPDGDFVDVDRLVGPRDAPALLVLHGLEGNAQSHYVRGMLWQAQRRGMRAFAFHFRSCSGEPNRLLRSYHSGETGDLDAAVRRLAAELGGAPLLLAGFSLGGNVLVKWLGEQGEAAQSLVRAAAAVSVPFDLAACAAALDAQGVLPWIYRSRFLRSLKRKALDKASAFAGQLDEPAVRRVRTLREFDDVVTARVHGFEGAHDYWARSSSGPFVARVRVPLLLITSTDDPLVPGGCVPEQARNNPWVALEEQRRGGHVGFVEGPPWAPRFWAEERVADFLEERARRDARRPGDP